MDFWQKASLKRIIEFIIPHNNTVLRMVRPSIQLNTIVFIEECNSSRTTALIPNNENAVLVNITKVNVFRLRGRIRFFTMNPLRAHNMNSTLDCILAYSVHIIEMHLVCHFKTRIHTNVKLHCINDTLPRASDDVRRCSYIHPKRTNYRTPFRNVFRLSISPTRYSRL